MRIEEDMFYERKRKEVMLTPKDASLKTDGLDRHTRGKDVQDANIKVSMLLIQSVLEITSNSHCYKVADHNQYEVESSKQGTFYTVHIRSRNCLQEPNCVPQCTEAECGYLCRHMVECTCVDYVHGHLCKHAHKVHTFNHTSPNVCHAFTLPLLTK